MGRQRMDAETAETVAGVVRLLRRAAELVWAAADAEGAGSPRQLLALGIDLAADEARNLLPDAIPLDGPVPVGDEPAGLLRSAEQLLRRVATPAAWTGLDGLRTQVARPHVGGEHRCRRVTVARSASFWRRVTGWPARHFLTPHLITRRRW